MLMNDPWWSADMICPNGAIPHAVINCSINLEQNKKSIRFDRRMNVFGSFSVS